MKLSIVAQSGRNNNTIDIGGMKNINGKLAGICYCSNDYKQSIAKEDILKSQKRYDMVFSKEHHSIGHHYMVTLLIQDSSKMLAMILNSLKFYNTCERSGRYTRMGDNNSLYEKWFNYFYEEVIKLGRDEKSASKLAGENARYILSVFNEKSTLAYTTSYTQLQYILYWFKIIVNVLLSDYYYNDIYTPDNIYTKLKKFDHGFKISLSANLIEFITLAEGLGIETLKHPTDYTIDFFDDYDLNNADLPLYHDSFIGTVCVENMTFVALADLQRHRTTDMSFNMDSKFDYYIPLILKDINKIKEWTNDCKSVNTPCAKYLVTYDRAKDKKTMDKKIIKRMCARVQLEVQHIVADRQKHFNGDNMIKCDILGNCVEPCAFYKDTIRTLTRPV